MIISNVDCARFLSDFGGYDYSSCLSAFDEFRTPDDELLDCSVSWLLDKMSSIALSFEISKEEFFIL